MMARIILKKASLLRYGIIACALSGGSYSCLAASQLPLEQLSEVWQQEFGLAEYPTAAETTPAEYFTVNQPQGNTPHPAVVRVEVPEDGSTSYGSGTLIDVRDKFGLVITNWHVVRDARGPVEVSFPGGFRSKARALKVDHDWDLAALVIWRPPVKPVPIADHAPRPGDALTICGYGPGIYRSVTGRCTQYYSPDVHLPQQMVELNVEARQGDSGGPIFNSEGQLAGVLFGAGEGTTLGSFGGRVDHFLATLAPDIGEAADEALVKSPADFSAGEEICCRDGICLPRKKPAPNSVASDSQPPGNGRTQETEQPWPDVQPQLAGMWPLGQSGAGSNRSLQQSPGTWQSHVADQTWFEQLKTVLAAVGLVTVVVQMLRVAR